MQWSDTETKLWDINHKCKTRLAGSSQARLNRTARRSTKCWNWQAYVTLSMHSLKNSEHELCTANSVCLCWPFPVNTMIDAVKSHTAEREPDQEAQSWLGPCQSQQLSFCCFATVLSFFQLAWPLWWDARHQPQSWRDHWWVGNEYWQNPMIAVKRCLLSNDRPDMCVIPVICQEPWLNSEPLGCEALMWPQIAWTGNDHSHFWQSSHVDHHSCLNLWFDFLRNELPKQTPLEVRMRETSVNHKKTNAKCSDAALTSSFLSEVLGQTKNISMMFQTSICAAPTAMHWILLCADWFVDEGISEINTSFQQFEPQSI